MNSLLRRLLNYDLLDDVSAIARDQQETIADQQRVIDSLIRECSRLKLEYTRWGRGMVEEFLIALDKPELEDEVRKSLASALVDLSDEVARIEEHAEA